MTSRTASAGPLATTARRAPRRHPLLATTASSCLIGAALGVPAVVALTGPPAAALTVSSVTVPEDLRQGRVLVVRPRRVDVVQDGRVLAYVPFRGRLDLADLPRLVRDRRFVERVDPSTVHLRAVLALRPGARVLGRAPGLSRLVLGDTGAGPARLRATSAHLRLAEVTLSPQSPGSQSLSPQSPSPQTSGPQSPSSRSARSGPVLEASRTSLRLRAVTVRGGSGGITTRDAPDVVLDTVTVDGTAGDGIVVSGRSRVRLLALTAQRNAARGVVLSGDLTATRDVGPVRAVGNGDGGVHVAQVEGLRLVEVSTEGNTGAGILVDRARGVGLYGPTATGDVTGLVVKASSDVTVVRPAISGSREDGMRLSGERVQISEGTVAGNGEGLVVQPGSRDLTVGNTRVESTPPAPGTPGTGPAPRRIAVRVAEETRATTLRDVTLAAPGGVALRTSGTGLLLEGGSTTAATGLVTSQDGGATAPSTTELRGVDLRATGTGVRAGPGTRVALRGGSVRAGGVGVAASPGAGVSVTGADVEAPVTTRGRVAVAGERRWSNQPVRRLGVAVLAVIVTAALLEVVRKVRTRSEQRPTVIPVHVANRT